MRRLFFRIYIAFKSTVHYITMSSEQGEQQEEIGTEAWFATIVKLPCGGLDPSRDCNHVSDEEITTMFGEKLSVEATNTRRQK